MKIINYKVLRYRDECSLATAVQDHIRMQWQPLGGVSVNTYGHSQYFTQAVVEYEKQ